MSAAPDKSPYIGRFAPSPTGPLHFGSLIAAVASYVDARHFGGQWLVRVEDLDPPREQKGASDLILRCLEAHQLHWDGDVLYQSQRHDAYAATLADLKQRGLIYPCYCTRKALAGGPYPGTCRRETVRGQAHSWRLLTAELPATENQLAYENGFSDLLLGPLHCDNTIGDFILRRKDGLFAYQLAVVVDDIFQGITHVVRGVDLLDSTPPQRFLFACLGAHPPHFGHLALALNKEGQKLSKQHGAKAVDPTKPGDNIYAALCFLNHQPDPELKGAGAKELLQWASEHWDRNKVPHKNAVVEIDQ